MPRETDEREIEEREVDERERADADEPGDRDEPEGSDDGGRDDETDDTSELSGDEEEGSVDDEGGDGADEPASRSPSRAQQRIQRLADERAADRAEKEALRRELAELRGTVNARTQTETAAQRDARLALMTPEERSEFRLNEANEQNRQAMAALQYRLEDNSDRAAFEAKATIDPVYRRHQAEVEQRLAALRQQGGNVPRESLLKFVIGEKALERARKDGNRHQRRGKEAIERERVRPTNGKGDVQTRRGKEADTPRKRLEGQFI